MTSVPSRTEILDDIIAILSEQTGVSFFERDQRGNPLLRRSRPGVDRRRRLDRNASEALRPDAPLPRADGGVGRRTERDLSIGELVAFLGSAPLNESRHPAMPKLVANGIEFHYQQAGAGPDVVLIHGVTGDLSIWFLCEAMGILGRSFRVTAFDLRGHGYSDVPGRLHLGRPGRRSSGDHGRSRYRSRHARWATASARSSRCTPRSSIPDRVDALVLSDPCFPALRHLEDVSRWGHWQNFRQEAADAGVTLSDEHWYDLGRFFDQVLHLDGERLLAVPPGRRPARLQPPPAAGGHHLRQRCQGPGRPDRRADSERDPAGARRSSASIPRSWRRRTIWPSISPNCVARTVAGAKHRAPEENGAEFVEIVNEFLIANLAPAQLAKATR